MALPATGQEKSARAAVQCADLAKDKPRVLVALEQYLGVTEGVKRFDWLYLENPYGLAKAWMLVQEGSQEVLGAAAIFPRPLLKGGKNTVGYVFGDFCLKPSWRSLGPGIQLQKACMLSACAGEALSYDMPSAGMLAIYKRIGQGIATEMVRYARPLRMNRKVSERLPFLAAAEAISSVGNELLRWRDILAEKRSSWAVSTMDGPFGNEFDDLNEHLAENVEVRVARSSAYLNWRFLGHPYRRPVVLVAKNGAKLGGFLILDQDQGQMSIIDVQSATDSSAIPGLLEAATKLARRAGSESLSFSLLKNDSLTVLLREIGFRPRESRPVVLFGTSAENAWHLFDGDRES